MEKLNIELKLRSKGSDSKLRKLREKGYVPGVLYGTEESNNLVQLNEKELNRQIKGYGNYGIFNVEFGDEVFPVKINEIQRDTLDNKVVHLDLQKVEMDKKVEILIPIHLYGDARGVRSGGIINQQIRSIKLRTLPTSVPESIAIDISDVEIGGNVRVGDIDLPQGIEIVDEHESIILTIAPPQKEDDIVEDIEVEPEVVNKGEEKK